MPSKEEIEEIKQKYHGQITNKDLKKIKEYIEYLENKTEQLEAEKKEVIEKLEDDIERSCCNGKYEGNFRKARWQDEYANEILEIMKGEKK